MMGKEIRGCRRNNCTCSRTFTRAVPYSGQQCASDDSNNVLVSTMSLQSSGLVFSHIITKFSGKCFFNSSIIRMTRKPGGQVSYDLYVFSKRSASVLHNMLFTLSQGSQTQIALRAKWGPTN